MTRSSSSISFSGFGFEVFGKVQGVFFRKYTRTKALELGLVGWVQNTSRGTVVGEGAGFDETARNQMKNWLQHVGPPSSHIDRVEFHELDVDAAEALRASGTFQIRRTAK
jgi:acylphosphatase